AYRRHITTPVTTARRPGLGQDLPQPYMRLAEIHSRKAEGFLFWGRTGSSSACPGMLRILSAYGRAPLQLLDQSSRSPHPPRAGAHSCTRVGPFDRGASLPGLATLVHEPNPTPSCRELHGLSPNLVRCRGLAS